MNRRNTMVKLLSALIVVLLLLNPDTAHLGALVDAVGLDMLLMLFQVQLVMLVYAFRRSAVRTWARTCIGGALRQSFRGFASAAGVVAGAVFPMSQQVALMHMLVASAIVGAVLNITWR